MTKTARNLSRALIDSFIIWISFFIFATLFFAYDSTAYNAFFSGDLPLLFIAIASWVSLGYIAELYDPNPNLQDSELKKSYIFISIIWLLIMIRSDIDLFLSSPLKTCFIFLITLCLTFIGRLIWLETGEKIIFGKKVIFLGQNLTLNKIADYLKTKNDASITITSWLKDGLDDQLYPRINILAKNDKVDLIVIADNLIKNNSADNQITELVLMGYKIISASDFGEDIMMKTFEKAIDDQWISKRSITTSSVIGLMTSFAARLIALIALIALFPLMLLIGIIIKLTSTGSMLISQVRTGQFNKTFVLYKFRSMRSDAEKDGAKWADINDSRVTPFGSILRATHLDELPQLWNIIIGDIAFVGPRPERPELINSIKKVAPLFDLRLLAKPGITGWAQISYHYGRTPEDAREKLAYDLYYISHQSLWFDAKIILRTIRHFLV